MPLSQRTAVLIAGFALFAQGALFAQADFSISVPPPSSQTVWQAQSTTYTITVTPTGGFTGTVTFSTQPLPYGVTATFNPTSVTGSGSTTMTLTASPGAATGSSTITVTGTSTPLSHNTSVTLNVVVPPPINYTYDAVGRLTSVTDQFGESAIYNYDAVGNLLSITRQGTNQITISSFSPSSGLPGATVTILGSGFNSTPSQNTVKFNGVTATVTSSSNTQIVTTVPAGATSGTITVQNSNGTATSGSAFTVLTAPAGPSISSFTPALAPSATPLIITGTNFFTNTVSNTVKIGPTTLNVLSSTATTINAATPNVVSSGKITVQTPSGTATSAGDLISVPAPYRLGDVVLSQRATLGTPYTMTFTASGQAGLLIFDGTQNQTIKFLANASAITFLTLFGPDGAVLLNSLGVGGEGGIFSATLPSTGTYTALVKGPVTGCS